MQPSGQHRLQRWGSACGRAGMLVLAALVVLCAIGLSAVAVVQVQFLSRPEGGWQVWFYAGVFLLCELWVAIGLSLLVIKLKRGAWLSALAALLVWAPAVGLSAQQEFRFHELLDGEIAGATETAQRSDSYTLARLADLDLRIAALTPPARSANAVTAELERYSPYPQRYRTRLAELRAELADIEMYEELIAARDAQRGLALQSADSHGDHAAAKQIGRAVNLPGTALEIPEAAMIWVLIGWLMLVKALGPYLLLTQRRSATPNPPIVRSSSVIRVSGRNKKRRLVRQL